MEFRCLNFYLNMIQNVFDINNPALEVNYFSKLQGLPILKLNMIDGFELLLGSTVVVLDTNIFLVNYKYAEFIKSQKNPNLHSKDI